MLSFPPLFHFWCKTPPVSGPKLELVPSKKKEKETLFLLKTHLLKYLTTVLRVNGDCCNSFAPWCCKVEQNVFARQDRESISNSARALSTVLAIDTRPSPSSPKAQYRIVSKTTNKYCGQCMVFRHAAAAVAHPFLPAGG